MTQKWLSSTINGIDSEDAKLVEQVSPQLGQVKMAAIYKMMVKHMSAKMGMRLG